MTAAACLLPAAALHAQTTLQSPGGLGESAAQPAGQPMATPMGQSMVVPMSPAASISQPFPPVTGAVLDTDREGLRFRALAGVERDSNVTRVSSGKISDTITDLGVGLRFNKRYGLQRVVVDGEYDHYDFDKLSTKYNTLNYSAAWYWAVGNVLDGVASADRKQFRDVTVSGGTGVINRRTERNELLEGRYKLGAAWRVLAGVQHTDARSTDPTNSWDGDPNVNSERVGVQYELATGSSITGRYRHGTGDYQVGLAPSFKDDESEVVVHWAATPKTALDARLAQFKRDHSGAPTRNFDGTVGSLAATWDATAKTRLIAGWSHDLGSYLGGTGGHLESDRIYIAPTWRATAQTAFSFRYEHENRKWADVTGSLDAGRTDKFNVAALGLDWQPWRTVGMSAQLRNERRSSSLPIFNYRANVVGLAVKLSI
ncbi:MAG: hypothetical protein ACXWJJ_06050 [Ramlibacter sp.]